MAGAQVAWGIDVGVSSLKAIKLRRDGDRVTVEAFEVIEHDKFLTEPDVNRDALIRATLQKFMAKYAVRRETIYIGVPGSSTFARFVKLPPVETKKIPEIVRFEAIQQIPFPLDQVNWDFHTFQHPESPDVEVGIFAMKKELVAQVLSNFQAVDMPIQGVQMSPLAVYNAAAYDGMTDDKGAVVIDMGAEHTDLVVMDQGRLWLRTINIGGNHFTDALAKSFKQSFSRAEQLKKGAATSKYQKQIFQAMRPIFADLVAEIQRSIGHYNSSHRDARLERIVGMGSPFKLPNLQKYMQQELKMEVIRVESFAKANVEKAAAFGENVLSMAAAYGLAVQALGLAPINSNLLPTEIARKMMWRKKQPWFVGAAALVALGAVGMGAQWWLARTAYAGQDSQLNANNEEIQRVKLLSDQWKKIPDTFSAAQAQIDQAMNLAESRALWPSLLLDVYAALPQYIPGQPPIIITGIISEYHGKLSDFTSTLASSGTTAAPVSTTVGQAQTPGGAAPAAVGVVGDSDHGFIIIVTGYAPSGQRETIKAYRDALLQLAPVPIPPKDKDAPPPPKGKPYYFSSAEYTGSPIPTGRGAAAPGGVCGFAAGGMGAGTPSGPVKAPWGGGAHGPFWDIFVSDITGFKPQPAAQPGGAMGPGGGMDASGNGGVVDFQYAPDLAAPKTPTGPRPIGGAYQFTLLFKVHVK